MQPVPEQFEINSMIPFCMPINIKLSLPSKRRKYNEKKAEIKNWIKSYKRAKRKRKNKEKFEREFARKYLKKINIISR